MPNTVAKEQQLVLLRRPYGLEINDVRKIVKKYN
jgi:hypothetical protein